MATKRIYRATNESTGEVIEGTAKALSIQLDVHETYIYASASSGNKIGGVWLVELIQFGDKLIKDKELLKTAADWDALTEPIRQYIRRRDNAKKKQ